jgi:hypothetical protein
MRMKLVHQHKGKKKNTKKKQWLGNGNNMQLK